MELGTAGLDGLLCAAGPLTFRRYRHEEGVRDLGRGQPTDDTRGQRHLRGKRQRRVAAQECVSSSTGTAAASGDYAKAAGQRGIGTINLWADDLPAATSWYTELLGTEPYFSSEAAGRGPGYVEFRIGDYEHELGIIDRRFAPAGQAAGPGGGHRLLARR